MILLLFCGSGVWYMEMGKVKRCKNNQVLSHKNKRSIIVKFEYKSSRGHGALWMASNWNAELFGKLRCTTN